MRGGAPSSSVEALAQGHSVIASEAEQSRSRRKNAWANALCSPWIASPSARNDELCEKAGARFALTLEWAPAAAALLVAGLTLHGAYETIVLIATLAAVPLVAWIIVQDLKSLTIADGAVVALAVLALAVRVAAGDPALVLVVDVLLSGGVLLAFREIYYRRRGFDGLGLGDVKLAAAGGLLVGGQTFAWAMLGASLAALGAVAAAQLLGRAQHEGSTPQKLAFGAFLAPALLVAWIVEQMPVLWPGSA